MNEIFAPVIDLTIIEYSVKHTVTEQSSKMDNQENAIDIVSTRIRD